MIRLVLALVLALSLVPLAGARGRSGSHHSTRTYKPYKTRKSAAARCATCPRDRRGHLRRNPEARAAFQKTHPCPATGKTTGACPGYVVDHIVPLKRGGADAPSNMQWQTVQASKAKDKVE